jgi:predicted nucleotidyltransferase
MEVDKNILAELVRRIVDAAHPMSIVLFGSAARGEMGPHSDLDVLVVVPAGTHRRKTAQLLYSCLYGLGFAKDIVVATEDDIAEHGDNPGLIYRYALREGKEIYHAA